MARPGFSFFLASFYVVVYFIMDACLVLLSLFSLFCTKPRVLSHSKTEKNQLWHTVGKSRLEFKIINKLPLQVFW